MNDSSPRSHVGQKERSHVGYLSVHDRVKFLRLCHANKITNDSCPPYLHDNFIRVSAVRKYNTRSSSFNFGVPKVKGVASTTFLTVQCMNGRQFQMNLKKVTKLNVFKSAIKEHLGNSALSFES